ncbi:MAG: hypothetical protein EB830_00370 [Nitrosopumilus sp. H13]|nr:MAG: hypothetical protein EB830_00370 [Nitrosopumilus sp. H13]
MTYIYSIITGQCKLDGGQTYLYNHNFTEPNIQIRIENVGYMAERLAIMMSIAVTVAAVATSMLADPGVTSMQNENTPIESDFVDEHTQATDELNNWLDGEKSLPLKDIPILGMVSKRGVELFVPVNVDHADLADVIKEKLRQTYPGLDIIIDVVVIDTQWGGESLAIEITLP